MSNGNGATEVQRTVMLKRIVDPNDPNPDNPTSYVDVPVITAISFLDPGDQQVYDRTFDNTAANQTRQTHLAYIQNRTSGSGSSGGSGGSTRDTSSGGGSGSTSFAVERIDTLQVQNADQVEYVTLNNDDPAPLPAPSDPGYNPQLGHLQTHVVRYNKDNTDDPNSSPWIDVELVDAIEVRGFLKQRADNSDGGSDNQQLVTLNLDNDTGDKNFTDPNDPFSPTWSDNTYWQPQGTLPQDSNGNPDPVRLDPFQNIVNVSWGGGGAVHFTAKGG